MLITIRAYRHSDLDLMLLGDAFGKNYSSFIRECLRCYLRGIPLRAGIPQIAFIPDHEITSQSKSTGVMLKEDEDADIVALMKNIRYGYRNNFVKNVVRMYTAMQCVSAYAANQKCFDKLNQSQNEKLNDMSILECQERATKKSSSQPFVPKEKSQKPMVAEVTPAEAVAVQEVVPTIEVKEPVTAEAPKENIVSLETAEPVRPSSGEEDGAGAADLDLFNDFMNLIG